MNDISWNMIFDGWVPVVRTLVLGASAYAALVVLLRASGKRTLSKMNAFDFVVTIAFGSVLAAILTSQNVSLVQGVVALALLIFLQWVNTQLAMRMQWYSQLIKAQPTLVFFRGDFLLDAIREQRLTKQEVLAAMREHGVTDPAEVDAVVLETEGSLSVLTDGLPSQEALEQLGVDAEDVTGPRRKAPQVAP